MVPVIHVLSVFFSTVCGLTCASLKGASFCDDSHADLFDLQCAAYGLRTDRLTPHPLNLCSNAGSTRTSISQTQPLDMTFFFLFDLYLTRRDSLR